MLLKALITQTPRENQSSVESEFLILIKTETDINGCLLLAASNHRELFAEWLITKGNADVNYHRNNLSALTHAVWGVDHYKSTLMVEQLLALGAVTHGVNGAGETLLMLANDRRLIDLLIKNNVPLDAQDNQGNTYLMRKLAYPDIVQALLTAKAI